MVRRGGRRNNNNNQRDNREHEEEEPDFDDNGEMPPGFMNAMMSMLASATGMRGLGGGHDDDDDEDEPEEYEGDYIVDPTSRRPKKWCGNCRKYHFIDDGDEDEDEDEDDNDDDSVDYDDDEEEHFGTMDMEMDPLDKDRDDKIPHKNPYDEPTELGDGKVLATFDLLDAMLRQNFADVYAALSRKITNIDAASSTMVQVDEFIDSSLGEAPSATTLQPLMSDSLLKDRKKARKRKEIDEEDDTLEDDPARPKKAADNTAMSRKLKDALFTMQGLCQTLLKRSKAPSDEDSGFGIIKNLFSIVPPLLYRSGFHHEVLDLMTLHARFAPSEILDHINYLMVGYSALECNHINLAIEVLKNAYREKKIYREIYTADGIAAGELYYLANAIQNKLKQYNPNAVPPHFLSRYHKLRTVPSSILSLRNPLPRKVKVGVINQQIAITSEEDLDDSDKYWIEEEEVYTCRKFGETAKYVPCLNAVGIPVFYYMNGSCSNDGVEIDEDDLQDCYYNPARCLLTDPVADTMPLDDRNLGNKNLYLVRKDLHDITLDDLKQFVRFAAFVRKEIRKDLELGIQSPMKGIIPPKQQDNKTATTAAAASSSSSASSSAFSAAAPRYHHRHRSSLPDNILFLTANTPEQLKEVFFSSYLTKHAFDKMKEPNAHMEFTTMDGKFEMYSKQIDVCGGSHAQLQQQQGRTAGNSGLLTHLIQHSAASDGNSEAALQEQINNLIKVANCLVSALDNNNSNRSEFKRDFTTAFDDEAEHVFVTGDSAELQDGVNDLGIKATELQSQIDQQNSTTQENNNNNNNNNKTTTTKNLALEKNKYRGLLQKIATAASGCSQKCEVELSELDRTEEIISEQRENVLKRFQELKKKQDEEVKKSKDEMKTSLQEFRNEMPMAQMTSKNKLGEFLREWERTVK